MKRIYLYITGLIVYAGTTISCGTDFLDIKSIANQTIPHTLGDYQAILDRLVIMNEGTSITLAMIAGEEFEVSDQVFNAMTGVFMTEQNAYVWRKGDIFNRRESRDWDFNFQRIMHANMAMDVERIIPSNTEKQDWENIKGTALFHHAWNYFRLMIQFGMPWSENIADEICPIPFRTSYDVEVVPAMLTYREFYARIIRNLIDAESLLPIEQPAKTRPNKAAANLLLSKVYLQMHDYPNALLYSDRCLDLSSGIIDYNTVNSEKEFPFDRDYGMSNREVLYFHRSGSILPWGTSYMNVSPDLLKLYEEGDLRKMIYFLELPDGRVIFRGSYHGGNEDFFIGLSVVEAYLIKAECLIREKSESAALDIMNYLRKNRMSVIDYTPLQQGSQESMMQWLLQERRKEFCFRGIRWEDVRRLNAEGRYTFDLSRVVEGKVHQNRWDSGLWFWDKPILE